ncbi:MAG: alpha/beta fold hydrolase [Candidatus Binatia bacterium]
MAPTFVTKYIDHDGTALHYVHTGSTTLPEVPPALDRGKVFLLVHAAGGTAGSWRRQLEGLAAAGQSAVALDLPGHGRSGGVDGCPTVEAYADCVAVFARALRLPPVVLVGRSMGGAIGLVLAARHPELLCGLVVVSSAARFTLDPAMIATVHDVVRGRLPQQFGTEAFSPATGMDVMREAWMEQVKTDPRVRYGDLLACQAFDGKALLGRVKTPTLVVAGADDRITPVVQAQELASGITGARLEVVPQAGHQAPLEQSATFNRLLTVFAGALP